MEALFFVLQLLECRQLVCVSIFVDDLIRKIVECRLVFFVVERLVCDEQYIAQIVLRYVVQERDIQFSRFVRGVDILRKFAFL